MNRGYETNVIDFPARQAAMRAKQNERTERSFLAFWLVLLMGGGILGSLLNLLGFEYGKRNPRITMHGFLLICQPHGRIISMYSSSVTPLSRMSAAASLPT